MDVQVDAQVVPGRETARRVSDDLFRQWLDYLDARPKTVATYTRSVRQFFLWLTEHNITRPEREDIIAYRDQLLEHHKATTVQAYLAAVRQFFRWTQMKGIYPDVADRVKGARVDRNHKRDYLSERQAIKILQKIDRETLKGKRDFALLALMMTTGIRTVEVCRADVRDFSVMGGVSVLFLQGKGHDEKSEYVKVEPHSEDAIREYLAAMGKRDPDGPLFCSLANRNPGGRMTTRSISRVVKQRMEDVNLISDRLSAHSLRHTAATLNLLHGGTTEETQQLLRHANINTTMIYSHALERIRNDSEVRIGTAIFGGQND